MNAPNTLLQHCPLSDVSLLLIIMIVGPPYPITECISRLQDNPFASEENNRCHRPEASVSDVQESAKRSNDEDTGVEKNVLVGDVWVIFFVCSIVRFGIHRGATPGGNDGSLPSPELDGEKKVKSTCRNVGSAEPNIGACVSAHSLNSSRDIVVSSPLVVVLFGEE